MAIQPKDWDREYKVGLVFELVWGVATIAAIILLWFNRYYFCFATNIAFCSLFFSVMLKKSLPSKYGPVDMRDKPIRYHASLVLIAIAFIITFILFLLLPILNID